MSMRKPVTLSDLFNAIFIGDDSIGIQGDAADDAADLGQPVMVGGAVKKQDGTDPGAVSAEGDRAYITLDENRRLYVNPFSANLWGTTGNWATAQATLLIKTSPGSGQSLYVTDIVVSNNATVGNIIFHEWPSVATPTDIIDSIYLGSHQTVVVPLNSPLKVTASYSLGITSTGVGSHSVYVAGYTAK